MREGDQRGKCRTEIGRVVLWERSGWAVLGLRVKGSRRDD